MQTNEANTATSNTNPDATVAGIAAPQVREIKTHRVNPANDTLSIYAADPLGPGAGGAYHRYEIAGAEIGRNASALSGDPRGCQIILFQNGPIPETGVNGLTQEVLLAIVRDRLESFQAGPYACQENADALAAVIMAQEALHSRTRKRMERGVEGTHTV